MNTRNAGVVWLRTIPIHPDDRARDLRVMAESYVAAVSGTHYETAQLEGSLYRTTTQRTFATNIVGRSTGYVAGLEAYGVVVDVADVAQLELNPNARHKRVALVVIRTPFTWKIKRRKLPVLMIAGYADLDTDFDPGAGPLIAMLERLQVGDAYGVNMRLGVAPPATTATQAPVAPTGTPGQPGVVAPATPGAAAPVPAAPATAPAATPAATPAGTPAPAGVAPPATGVAPPAAGVTPQSTPPAR